MANPIQIGDNQIVYPINYIAGQLDPIDWRNVLAWGCQKIFPGEYVMCDAQLHNGNIAYGIKCFDEEGIFFCFYVDEDKRDMVRAGLVNRMELNIKIQQIYNSHVVDVEPGSCMRFQFKLAPYLEKERLCTVLFYKIIGIDFLVSGYSLREEDINQFIEGCELQEVGIPPAVGD